MQISYRAERPLTQKVIVGRTAPKGSSAGWRAIWVHPPAGAAGAFDVSGAAKASKGPVVPEAEVAKVAEAGGGRGW